MRTAELKRETAETKIELSLSLEGRGRAEIETGCGFLDHMLTLFAAHGRFDLSLRCQGDTQVDDHHTVEDAGIALGAAFAAALGDKAGIRRYGSLALPMDEALVLSAADLSGRTYLGWVVPLPAAKVGTFDTELAQEFWWGFVRGCPSTLHIRELAGENTHHILEAVFKGMGRALREAVAIDERLDGAVPSTKGSLI